MNTAIISSDGFVAIPEEMLRHHNLKPGDRVQLVDYGGQIAILPIPDDPIAEAAGTLAEGPSLTQALLEERAVEREREEREYERWGRR